MAKPGMDLSPFVGKLLEEQDGDVLREASACSPRRSWRRRWRAGRLLKKALGLDGLSKSEVSRMCGELDTIVAAFRTRALTGEHRYLWCLMM